MQKRKLSQTESDSPAAKVQKTDTETETKEYGPQTPYQELLTHGVTVYNIYDNPAQCLADRTALLAAVDLSPEFKKYNHLGGFGAMGHPSSYHNIPARDRRNRYHVKGVQFFSSYIKLLDEPASWNLEQLPDRTSIRYPGTKTGAEQWHRDSSPAEGIVFGGWVNYDDKNQYFSCVIGTHGKAGPKGFAKLSKEESDAMGVRKTRITVPPECAIIFDQTIVHEIDPVKCYALSVRQYVGWRVSKDIKPMFTGKVRGKKHKAYDLDKILNDQGCPALPSWQQSPLFSANHNSCLARKITSPWAVKHLIPQLLTRTVGDDPEYLMPERFLPSLRELGLSMYRAYTTSEKAIFTPARKWTLPDPDQPSWSKVIKL